MIKITLPDGSVREFAQDQIYVDKFESWDEVLIYLNDFNREEEE